MRPAKEAALEDMRNAGIDTSVLTREIEEKILLISGVYGRPNFRFMNGGNNSIAFQQAYKKKKL